MVTVPLKNFKRKAAARGWKMKPIKRQLLSSLFFLWTSLTFATDKNHVELPLCPKQLDDFPQDLPMHCRMPRNIDSNIFGMPDFSQFPTLPPDLSYPDFQRPPPDKQIPPLPVPVPPFPGMPRPQPNPGPLPGAMPGMMPEIMPGAIQGPLPGPIPMPLPMPMPMPVPMPGPPNKLPVIVMPFYSPDRRHYKKFPPHPPPKKKKPPHRYYSSDDTSDDFDDTSDSTESEDEGWWKRNKYGIKRRSNSHDFNHHSPNHHQHRRGKKKAELLTPILQYVTKDGYVIFEKKITKNEANGWLGPKEQAKVNEEELAAEKDAELLHEQNLRIETETSDKDTPSHKPKNSIERGVEINEIKEQPEHSEQNHKKHKRKRVFSFRRSGPQS